MALIVYDMQVGVVGQLAQGAAITERVARVLDSVHRSGMRVTRRLPVTTFWGRALAKKRSVLARKSRNRAGRI